MEANGPIQFEDPHRKRRTTYIVVGLVVIALLITGLVVRRTRENTPAAETKATQLQQAFQQAGLPVPDKNQIVNLLGADGGAVCEDPNNALKQAIANGAAANGAAGPGMRPVYTPRQLVTGEELVLSVYCPDELPGFLKFINEQKFADTIKE
ncbi:MAG TPA: hypothetical protein VF062_01855 [Candidatus Limnocylindrales bacterium]